MSETPSIDETLRRVAKGRALESRYAAALREWHVAVVRLTWETIEKHYMTEPKDTPTP